MHTHRFAWIAAAALAGCGAPAAPPAAGAATPPSPTAETAPPAPADAAPPDAPPQPPQRVTVTVVSADVAGLMPNGEQWDAGDAKDDRAIDRVLAAYLDGHPELARSLDVVGVPIDAPRAADEAARSEAADPMVLVQIDGQVFRSPMRPRAFNPVWNFAFEFAVRPQDAERHTVRIVVADYDGPTRFDPIGATVVPLADLLRAPVVTLGPFGSVKRLTLEVATAPLPTGDEPEVVQRIAVAASATWTDTGVDLVAGQRVTVDASDEVCTKGDDVAHCAGPEGQRAPSDYNVAGFADVGHGALIAAVGDTRFYIGRERSFVAPSSGRLRLGVNDRDTGNNRGAFAARVRVWPPALAR
ncbi:MAG: hypothetical protein D6689_03440 [Deltaproteobacteria bacterium]|nr:MAG: hypothetical protein D6689_03440 [Deltaproteobacteria bacterium]